MGNDKKVCEILRKLSGMEVIDKEDSLVEDLCLDSLNMVVLLLEIEETFDIELDESDMNPLDLISVSDVVSLVEKYVVKNNA